MKSYLIIGGSSGIGRSLSQLLIEDGHEVYGTYHSNLPDFNQNKFQKLDVLEGEINLGSLPDKLDGLVYCPGSINLKPFGRIKAEEFVDDYRLQVIGAIKAIQSVMPLLKKPDQSSIILFSTVAVQHGFNFHSQVSASKGAIEGLTKALSAEFAPKVRVNAIAPSLTHTNLSAKLLSSDQKIEANAQRHPLNRIGKPKDIAEMANFLLSEKSSWITGQVIPIDGGMSAIK
ncbi:MAG: SDR family NAD(P)-dependent oxidoreductase [Salibacteraceae bacterium]